MDGMMCQVVTQMRDNVPTLSACVCAQVLVHVWVGEEEGREGACVSYHITQLDTAPN